MYISKVVIENYRCFGSKKEIKLKPGVNVFIGENNSGKTTVLNALGLLFDRRGRSLPGIDDFNKNLEPSIRAPKITVAATLSSTGKDTLEDKALVATWLTSIEEAWEAHLIYSYHLPEEDEERFIAEIKKNKGSKDHFWKTLENFQPKYVSRIYCGNEKDRRRPEPDSLDKFEMRFLKAIRDVESEMFSGTQPLLRKMLQQVLDNSKTEAHLHPALQYNLLKYFTKQDQTRQMFMTTHSTHITAGAGLDPIISLSSNSSGEMIVVYPSECFQENSSGLSSRKYVERYLDATKSNMLFSKGVLFVEGITEQLLIPTLTEYIPGCDLEKQHVSVINVGGSTFKHFLPLFGAKAQTGASSLQCQVGCIPDGDPKRRRKNHDKAKYKKCYPYQIDRDPDQYKYQALSSVVTNLEKDINGIANIQVSHSVNTLEYDLAFENENSNLIVTDSCTNKAVMEEFRLNKDIEGDAAKKLLDEKTIEDLKTLDKDKQGKAVFASAYIESLENAKGEHALDLANALRNNAEKTGDDKEAFAIPEYITKAIKWVCRKEQE
jgi:predicted ATP-dependent endonuclease of OLD family